MNRQALVEAILHLENDHDERLHDKELAHLLAHHVKRQVDQLVNLRTADPAAMEEEDGEAASENQAVENGDADTETSFRKNWKKEPLGKVPEPDLNAISCKEQAAWIFMDRFISLERHEEILGYNFESGRFAEYQASLDTVMKDLLMLPKTIEAVETNNLAALQKTFASCVLVFRNPCIGDGFCKPVPCSFQSLKQAYPSYFYGNNKQPNWYEKHPFYTETIVEPRWVLCDTEYLNCTLRKPEKKLASYAKNWDLPNEYVRLKNVVEDIYDRIICGEALDEDLFANSCNALTGTKFRNKNSRHLVYTVQRGHNIIIHGQTRVPHWKATKRLWPGIFPTMIFP